MTPLLLAVLPAPAASRLAAMTTTPRRDPDRVVAHAVAAVELAGGSPDADAIALARQVAAGDLDGDTAVATYIRGVLGSDAT